MDKENREDQRRTEVGREETEKIRGEQNEGDRKYRRLEENRRRERGNREDQRRTE